MRNGSYLPQPHERASIKWQSSSLLVSELAPLMPLAPPGQGPYFSSLHCLTVHFSARTWAGIQWKRNCNYDRKSIAIVDFKE